MSVPRLPRRPPEAIPVLTDGPLAAASFAWQLLPPQNARVVVVKSTLRMAVPEGIATPLPEQDPPTGDLPYDDPPGPAAPGPRSPVPTLRYPSDFVPFKPKADVLLVGHAYPQSASSGLASVQLVFGKLHRALAALGDRVWDGVPTAPAPFTRMPLRYERAFGGAGYDANPMGSGFDGARLPNLEHPDRLIRSRGDRPAPACFAPVPAAFRARASKLGSYDGAWLRERWPYYPRDFDYGYFNCAPPEQQIAYPRGDEPFSLSGVSPTVPVLRGQLPGLSPRVYTVSTSGALREIPIRLDTVWLDADALRVVLVWRGIVDVSAQHAPEIAALFACEDHVGGTLDVPGAEQRFEAKMVELHGPLQPGTAGTGPAPAGAAAGGAAAEASTKPFAAGEVVAPPAKSRDEVMALLASGAPLAGVDLSRCDLSSLDLRGRKMPGALLSGAAIDGARFDGADLAGAVLAGAKGSQPSFRDASLKGANLAGAVLRGAVFAGATLSDASLPGAECQAADFSGAVLERANLTDAALAGAIFDGARATAADLSGASLEGASLRGAVLDDVSMYGCLATGCVFDDAKMARFRADEAKLEGASFARVQAAESSFEAARLARAVFAEATLDGSVFGHADLTDAVLSRASAKGARLRHATLAGVAAQKANWMEAGFEAADLRRADLRGANLYGVETLDAKLDGARLDGALVAGSKLA